VLLTVAFGGGAFVPAVGSGAAGTGRLSAARVAPCAASGVTGTLDLGAVGGSDTSPAGAIVFHDVGHGPCTLRGAPTVSATNFSTALPLFEVKSVPHRVRAVVLTPGATGKEGLSSITWSFWGCKAGSYALSARFAGWSKAITVGPRYHGPTTVAPCSGTEQTVYVGAVSAPGG
jgi:hypothetical protein